VDSSFKQTDAASYDSVATPYDEFSELYTGPFAERLVSLAEIGAGELVLDLAAGSGIVSRRIAAQGARCIAADLSEGMLQVAASKTPGLRLVRMDAERSALKAGSVGAVVSLFGMLHFPEPQAALKACLEALKPGGRLAFAFGSPPPWPFALAQAPRIAGDYLRERRGMLLKAPKALHQFLEGKFTHDGAAETDLATHPHRAAGQLVSLTRQVGFTAIKTGWMRERFVIESAESFWDLEIVFSSRARKRIAKLTPQEAEQLRSEFVEKAGLVQQRRGLLVYDVAATWVLATKPA
jgi:ubiquinone/menaquinone biosynthesis C-methylase UbiE